MKEKKTIMVVDDNPDVIFAIKDGLESLNDNVNVVDAKNGKDALGKLQKQKPDLMILDIMMPVMDGWDLAAKMKEDKKLRSVPIVFLTAKTDDLSMEVGSITGQDYITKPYELMDLSRRINKVLATKT